MFSTLAKINVTFFVTFILSYVNAFSLDKFKILSFGKELRSLWEKEKNACFSPFKRQLLVLGTHLQSFNFINLKFCCLVKG